ncbi:hypothetical protein E8E11_005654 [Didymella keratinophila]|nr:hypothetical protein E8E11_005654 [Didymella keratinophila]
MSNACQTKEIDVEKQAEEPVFRPEHDDRTLEGRGRAPFFRIISGFSTTFACLMPVIAITALAQLSRTRDLLCITGFAVLFAISLIYLADRSTSRMEIFTATAAFSAVLVVFISQPVIKMPPGSVAPEISM